MVIDTSFLLQALDQNLKDADDGVPDTPVANDVEVSDKKAHRRLLNAVSRFDKTQHIRKSSRFEPALKKTEFDLVKSVSDGSAYASGTSVTLGDLVGSLKKTKDHLILGKQLKNTAQSVKRLERPLERPAAERIQRGVAYEKTRKSLNRWEAIVERNRAAEHQSFPLEYVKSERFLAVKNDIPDVRVKSDLHLAFEALNPAPAVHVVDDSGVFELTQEEIRTKRREMARFKQRESYRIVKARQQKKIKSKKYHKILKNEKLRKQVKDFETLQLTDPNAALLQLEKLETNRVLERANLRHKNTGTWAKNLKVRSKYDKDVRQELAKQLTVSRELTQKHKLVEDDVSSDDQAPKTMVSDNSDPFNPWLKKSKQPAANEEADQRLDELEMSYKKYWDKRNTMTAELKKYSAEIPKKESVSSIAPKKTVKKQKQVSIASKVDENDGWIVEELVPDKKRHSNIDDIFNEAEDTLHEMASKKIAGLISGRKSDLRGRGNTRKLAKKPGRIDLTMKKASARPVTDNKLDESLSNADDRQSVVDLKEIAKLSTQTGAHSNDDDHKINPDDFIKIAPKSLRTALPDTINTEFDLETDENVTFSQNMTISEAFADDDIVADFTAAKTEEVDRAKPKDLDTFLPGWGAWGGNTISEAKARSRSKQRLLLKMPAQFPRNDDNKARLYINEAVSEKLKSHLLTELPKPYTNAADFERYLRAPVSGDFVPQTAFRLLTKPAVTSKMGAIIEPMLEDVLLQTDKPNVMRRLRPKKQRK